MTEQQKVKLQEAYILIDSQYPDITYAIHRQSKALYITQGKMKTQELRILAENVEDWLSEINEIWEQYK